MPYRYLELTAADRTYLAALGTFVREDLEPILDEIATTLRDAEELQRHLPPGDLREQVRPGLERYLAALTSGSIEPYLEAVVSRVRQQVTEVLPYLGVVIAVMAFESVIVRRFLEASADVANRSAIVGSFLKFNQISLMAIANAYLEAKETTIHAQQEALLALSTPVVEFWQGILALPLIGTIDTARAKQITQSLLRSIRETQARVVILDITGVPLVDTRVANHLLKTIRAARLLGARGIVAGISPEIADTLISLDIDFEGISTYFSLRQALEAAIAMINDHSSPLETPR